MAVEHLKIVTLPKGALVWDASSARFTADELKAAGVAAVARYVYRGPWIDAPSAKYVTAPEIAAYHAAGVAVIPIDELVANECVQGGPIGLTTATGFVTGLHSLGWPTGAHAITTNDTDRIDKAGIAGIEAYNRAQLGVVKFAGYLPSLYAGSRQQWQVRDLVNAPVRPNASSWSPASLVIQWSMRQGWESADHRYDPNVIVRPMLAWLPHDVTIPDPPVPPTPEVSDMHPVHVIVTGDNAQFWANATIKGDLFWEARWTGPGTDPKVRARLAAFKDWPTIAVAKSYFQNVSLKGAIPHGWTAADFASVD